MAESTVPAAEVKAPAPGAEPPHISCMISISDAAPLSLPLRTLSAQQMALVLQQGRQKIEAMYEGKNRLGQEIAVAQSTKRSLQLDITFETEKIISRTKEAKALTLEKNLLEQEIADYKDQIQPLDDQLKVLTEQKHQHIQEIRTVGLAKDKLRHEVQVLKDEKCQLGREMPGAKALYDKLTEKTLAANRECNRLGEIIIEAKTEHDRVAQENQRLVRDVKRANAKKERVSQEIQMAEKEKERLTQDILAITMAANAKRAPAVGNSSTDQEGSSGTRTDSDSVGQAILMILMMVVVCMVLLYLVISRFPLLSFTAICMGLWILKLYRKEMD